MNHRGWPTGEAGKAAHRLSSVNKQTHRVQREEKKLCKLPFPLMLINPRVLAHKIKRNIIKLETKGRDHLFLKNKHQSTVIERRQELSDILKEKFAF